MPIALLSGVILLLFLVGFHSWYRQSIYKLEEKTTAITTAWQDTLGSSVQELSDRLSHVPEPVTRSIEEFDGQTKADYEKARRLWAAWLTQHQTAQNLLQQSVELQVKHRTEGTLWSSKGLLKRALANLTIGQTQLNPKELADTPFAALAVATEPSSVDKETLVEAVQSSTVAAEREYVRFQSAFLSSSQAQESIRRDIECQIQGAPDSLSATKKRFDELGLCFAPYEEQLSNLTVRSSELCAKLSRDPLAKFTIEQQALRFAITTLTQNLALSNRLFEESVKTVARLNSIDTRVQKMRSEELPSGIAGVSIPGTWKFDEAGYNPDADIERSKLLLDEFATSLKLGRLFHLDDLQDKAVKCIARACDMVETGLKEKQLAEQELTEVITTSLPADRESDQQTLESAISAYVAQQWALARKLTTPLKALHEKRLKTRSEADVMMERLNALGQELLTKATLVSTQLEADYADLVHKVTDLDALTKQGSGDWEELRVNIAALQAKAEERPESIESIRARMKAELATYNEFTAEIVKIRTELRKLESDLTEKWGGEEGVKKLASVQPAIDEIFEAHQKAKQDWQSLLEHAQRVRDSMKPVRDLVEADIFRDKENFKTLSSLAAEIETCHTMQYVRQVCGKVFGIGIYCPAKSLTKQFEQAKEYYEKRCYADMQAQIKITRSELAEKHLDAWWMCLQALSMSPDPCAQQFASQQGYAVGDYEHWMAVRLEQCLRGDLYNPPLYTGTNHKAGQFAAIIVGDAPTAKDYEVGLDQTSRTQP